MESKTSLELEGFLTSLDLQNTPITRIDVVLSREAEILKHISSKEIFLAFLKIFAKGKIEDLGATIGLSIVAAHTRNQIAGMQNDKQLILGELEIALLKNRICELFGLNRGSNRLETDSLQRLKSYHATDEETRAIQGEISRITLEEIMNATGITQAQIDSGYSKQL
ncbi:MAG: hypothetical protein PHO48_05210 [Candidatus Gracilibacteria bacterium]|nr:hypothetical protein [Candidatus Gracilibacteria bacterium]